MAITGAVQYALWSADGWTTVNPVGKVIGGQRGLDANARARRSIAGQESIVGGLMVPRISFEYLPETAALLQYIKRSAYPAGAVPEIGLEAGVDSEGMRLSACKCNRCIIDLAVEMALSVQMEFWSPNPPTATAGGTMAAVGQPTFEWYDGSVTCGGASYQARRVRIQLDNNLHAAASLDAKAAGEKRYPDALVEGYEEVAILAEYLADPAHDLCGDSLPTATIQLACTNGAETITFTATDAIPIRWRQEFVADELAVWRVEYRLPANSGNFSITVA